MISDSSNSAITITTPVTGRITRLLVAVGDSVTAGQPVATIESMKMEITITAPRDGRVQAIVQTAGAIIDANTVLIHLH